MSDVDTTNLPRLFKEADLVKDLRERTPPFSETGARNCARTFLESMEYAGLLGHFEGFFYLKTWLVP